MSQTMQSAFAAGLFDAHPPPPGLAAWNKATPQRRYAVYSNNVETSLTGALAARFPAAERIVGADFFRAMAGAFIRACPPRSPVLLAYGDAFPDFAARFEPARDVVYLADVMRLEFARGQAYHAADTLSLDPGKLAGIDPRRLGELIFAPHPSLSILSSLHPFHTIWAMNTGERPLADLEHWDGEHALVVRPRLIVDVIPLPGGCANFLRRLAAGSTLGEAAALAGGEDFDLSHALAILLRSGAFTTFREGKANENRRDD